jgi:hypothetical protein
MQPNHYYLLNRLNPIQQTLTTWLHLAESQLTFRYSLGPDGKMDFSFQDCIQVEQVGQLDQQLFDLLVVEDVASLYLD